MATSSVMPPEGLHPDSLPPEFDGWDSEPSVPTHPLGTVTGIDHDSGLPIVKRTAMEAPKPPAKEKSPETSAATEGAQPRTEDQPGGPMQKGTPVSYGGQPGRIIFAHPKIGVARVEMDDGKKLRSVNIKDLKVLPHTIVTSHVRRLNS